MHISFLSKMILGATLCALMAVPSAFAGEDSFLVAASKGKKKQAKPVSSGNIQEQLDVFAKNHLKNMNVRCLTTPSSYTEYDTKSLQTSYKPSANAAVQYIGYLHYDEVTYMCSRKKKDCPPSRRERMTELVMYINGKWTY